MLNIKPKTYNDVVRLSRCMELKKYIPELSDEKIEVVIKDMGFGEIYRSTDKHWKYTMTM